MNPDDDDNNHQQPLHTIIQAALSTSSLQQHPRKRPRKLSSTNTNDQQPIPIIIIESHARGLEALHSFIRLDIIPSHIETILHVDSHPDLAIPELTPWPLDQCEDMYSYLESTSGGIAEWLIPFLTRGHVKNLIWVRAKWCSQLQDGSSLVHVGMRVDNGRLGLFGSREPYWIDENVVVDSLQELVDPQPINLIVCHVDGIRDHLDILNTTWILDVCLDYFTTLNPFIGDAAVQALGSSVETAEQLRNCFLDLEYRHLERHRSQHGGGYRSKEEEQARLALKHDLVCLLRDGCHLPAHHFRHEASMLMTNRILDCDTARQHSGVIIALEDNADLPHHPTLDVTQQCEFLDIVKNLVVMNPPQAVMIAKSLTDGFTPSTVCTDLQNSVLEVFASANVKVLPIVEV